MGSTDIINETKRALKLKVGHNLVFTDLTTVDKGKSYKVTVDPNATYQEYYMGVDTKGNAMIINSDECSDSKSITIKEVNGAFEVSKVARQASQVDAGASTKRSISSFWSSIGRALKK